MRITEWMTHNPPSKWLCFVLKRPIKESRKIALDMYFHSKNISYSKSEKHRRHQVAVKAATGMEASIPLGDQVYNPISADFQTESIRKYNKS